ncbi:unnamed protein product [Aphanomyces euteiches]
MATQPTHRVETEHVDMIYDIKLDYHSQRIASCSSDRTVRIYEAKQSAPSTLVACLDVPCEGPLWRVAWSHPKFNVLAASTQCGKIAFYRNKAPAGAPEAWGLLSVHQTRSSSINSIEYAPHEYGLVIAAASADGVVSVVTMTQAGWVTTSTIQDNDVGCLGVSWAPYNSLGGQGMKRLVVGGCDSKVKIWSLVDGDSSQTWQQLEALPHGHNDWVRDVVWAPNAVFGLLLMHDLGQVLSVASGEDQVTLWKLAQQPDQTWKWSQVSSISEAGATATVIETY